MEWQIRNWLYFTWLSGDHIVEQAIHSIDKMQWLTGDSDIKSVNSIGGRQSRIDAKYGNVFDHFSVQYEFQNGITGNFTCRQQSGTDRYVGDIAYGTKGKVDFQRGRIYNQKGEVMIAVTKTAQQKLINYLSENNISSPLRIALMQGGCSGAALALAIDEAKDDDIIQSFGELSVLMNKDLLEQCGSISIDFIESGSKSGFSIQSSNPVPGVGKGCTSGSCNSGGCGC